MVVIWEALLILGLILANGFFSGAEIAIIAARRGRLKQLADAGDSGAKLALELAGDPNRFLPTVQIGITLVGTFAAAFGGARLAENLYGWLSGLSLGILEGHEHGVALSIVVLAITFFSVLLGELVPKRIALRNADGLARLAAPIMNALAGIGRPFVWFMGLATNAVLLLVGSRETTQQDVSLEDIEHLIQTGTDVGVLEPSEQKLAMEALRLGERSVRDIMRPRVDIDALDIDTPPDECLGAVAMAGMTRLPLYEGNMDHIIGFVNIKDVLRRHYLGFPIELRKILHPVLFVPETLNLDRLLVSFQEQGSHLAIVLDEFGGTEGMVTLQDVLEELVGEMRDEHQSDASQKIVARDETSWLIDGTVSIDEVIELLKIELPPSDSPRGYTTVAGLVLSELGKIPAIGDRLSWQGASIEVVDMDGPRIDRLLISLPRPSTADSPGPTDA